MIFLPSLGSLRNRERKYSCSDAVAWWIHASISPIYLKGSWEFSSIGLEFPYPFVNASINNFTTAFLRELQYSSKVYLFIIIKRRFRMFNYFFML